MDIILTDTSILIIVAIIFLLVKLSHRIYLKRRRKKIGILKFKQLGGIQISEKERKFLAKNQKYYYNRTKTKFTFKQFKEKFKKRAETFFNKLNPFWHKKEAEKLKKELSEARMRENTLRVQLSRANEPKKPVQSPEPTKRTKPNKPNMDEQLSLLSMKGKPTSEFV